MLSNKQLTMRFCLLQGMFFMLYAAFTGYFSLFLEDAGVATATIGSMQALICFSSAITQLEIGVLCDKYGASRSLFAASAFMCPLALYMVLNSRNIYILILATIMNGVFLNSLQSLCAGWIANLNHYGSNINFGVTRGFGSISYAIIIVVIGIIYGQFGGGSIPFIALVFGVLMLGASFLIPPPTKATSVQKINLPLVLSKLLKNKKYMIFMAAYVTFFFPAACINTYYPIFFGQLGGKVEYLGFCFFFLAASEMPVMLNYRKLERRFGVRVMFIVAALGFAFKNILIAFSPHYWWTALFSTLQAAGFAVALPCAQSYVEKIIPAEYSVTGQLVMSVASIGIAQILGNIMAGYLAGAFSVKTAIWVTGLMPFIGLVIFIIATKNDHSLDAMN